MPRKTAARISKRSTRPPARLQDTTHPAPQDQVLTTQTPVDDGHLPQFDEDAMVERITAKIFDKLGMGSGMDSAGQTSAKPPPKAQPTKPQGQKRGHKRTRSPSPSSSSSSSEDAASGDELGRAVCGTLNSLIASESASPQATAQDPHFQSAATPLGATLPSKLKGKIWAKEYVDFAAILSDKEAEYTITVTANQSQPSFVMASPAKSRPIMDINLWVNAFQTYAAVFTERHASEAPALFRYLALIRDMAYKGQSWQQYDQVFRKQKAIFNWAFDHIHWELYFQSQQRPSQRQGFQKPGS